MTRPNAGKGVGEMHYEHVVTENIQWYSQSGKPVGSFFKEQNKHIQAENEDNSLDINVYSALFITVQNWKQHKMMAPWCRRTIYTYNNLHESPDNYAWWKTHTYSMIPFIRHWWNGKIRKTESRFVVVRVTVGRRAEGKWV